MRKFRLCRRGEAAGTVVLTNSTDSWRTLPCDCPIAFQSCVFGDWTFIKWSKLPLVWLTYPWTHLTAGKLLLVLWNLGFFNYFSRKYWLSRQCYWMVINLSRISCLVSWMPTWDGCRSLPLTSSLQDPIALPNIIATLFFLLFTKISLWLLFIILVGNWQVILQLCSPLLT